MATKFRLKRSAVATKRPEVSDLLLGELALNTSDAFLFTEYTRAGTGTTVANLTPWQEKWGKNAVYYSGGSVGIGTTNPTSLVEVYGSNPVFTIQDNSVLSSNASATLRLAESDVTFHTGNYWDISHTTNNELAVSTGVQGGTVSEVLRIDGAGFVGINSADPRTHLEVVGITSTKELYVAGLSTFVGVATFKSDVWIDGSLFVKGVEIGPGHGITTPNLDIHDYVRHYGDLTTRFGFPGNGQYVVDIVGSRKLNITGAGVSVTAGLQVSGISTFHSGAHLLNNDVLHFGGNGVSGISTGYDLRIYSDGTDSYISETTGAGALKITGDNTILIQNPAMTQTVAGFNVGAGVSLYHAGTKKFETLAIGAYVAGTLTGDATMVLDPATVGDNTGTVQIKGNLQVDGTTTTVNSTTMTVADKNIEIAKGAANDAAAVGAGITVDSGGGDKTWNWVDATDSWTSSEHIDVASGKVFKINTAEVLSNTTLGSSVVNSNLQNVGTLTALKVSGVTTTGHLQVGSTGVGVATVGKELWVNGVKIGGPGVGIGTDLYIRNITATGIVTFQGQSNIGYGGTVFYANVDTGRIGIGDSSPSYMLDVFGAINSQNDVKINGTSVLTQASNDAVAMAIALG